MQKNRKRMIFTMGMFLLVISQAFARYQIDCVEDRGNEIVLNFTLSQYELGDVLINGTKCSYIGVRDAACLNKKGFPELPCISQSVIIPDNAAMDLEMVNIHCKELSVNTIVPSKGVVYRNQNPADIPYEFSDVYKQDTWYPLHPVTLGKPYIMRDIRGIVVCFQPFQYNPALGKLKIVESMSVKIKRVGTGTVNVLHPLNRPLSPAFDNMYRRRFINYAQNRSRYPDVSDGDRMIIISPTHYLNAVAPLAEWKNKTGIKTTVHDYLAETGGGAEGVESFIQKKYTNENLTYVLLIGDIQDILCFYVEGRGGDPIFALVSGEDSYPDIFVGRLSGESEAQIQTMVNKTITYEAEPDPNGDWYNKAMGIAGDESQGGPADKEWMEDFRSVMLEYNYSEVDRIYDPGASLSAVVEGVNAGRSWINYMGHGNKDFWGTTGFSIRHLEQLTNTNKLPIIISVACYNGDFSSGLACFGEAWLRYGSPTEAKGAVVFTASSIMQPWNPPQHAQKEMVKHLAEDTYLSVGGIFFNGEMKMIENGGGDNTFKSWNMFGDPSLQVFTDTPKKMQVTYPHTISDGQKEVTISFNSSINGRVCLYSEQSGIAGSQIVQGTTATFPVTLSKGEAELLLTVTARNRVPFQATVNVGPTAITTKDDAEAEPAGSFFAAPNPVDKTNTFLTLGYKAAGCIQVGLRVFDAVGNVVYTYRFPEGNNGTVQWDLKANAGKTVASGTYIAVATLRYRDGSVEVIKTGIGITDY